MADATIICGVNEDSLHKNMRVICIGSCTTNALAPVAKILHQHFSIQAGYATTVHSYTFDQNLLDNFHSDIRRARNAATSLIPTKSGVSSALKLVLPEIGDRITGSAIRVPVPNVSLVDFSFSCAKATDTQTINQAITDAADLIPEFLQVATAKLVSIDYNHNSASAIFDPFETQVINQNFARVLIWYDNEWGFVSRMVDVAKIIARF
jgi:glyceraldehyde 3-phosphate dehydrogenase